MGYQEIRNSAENWQGIMRAFSEGRAKDLNEEPKKKLQPVILTGSGPSLDDTIEKLKAWNGGVVCHYSQAPTLMYHGVVPDYIVALDAICNWEGLKDIDWAHTKTKLVLHPGMWPTLVANWPNEMLFYRQNLGKPDSFGVNEQKIMYCERMGTLQDALDSKVSFRPLIQTELTMFACTPPAQLFVAQVLQYGNVYLTGMDFAYHGTKERFTNYNLVDGQWFPDEHILPEREYITTKNGLRTDPLHMYYKKNFISACRLSMQQVFTTDKGAITEIPYISMDHLLKGKKPPKITPDARKLQYERYLAEINCFVVNFDAGSAFVEVGEPIRDITGFIMKKNREYICKTCGAQITANDDIDHTGATCNQCNTNKTERLNNCDLKENLKRIQSLVDYHKAVK